MEKKKVDKRIQKCKKGILKKVSDTIEKIPLWVWLTSTFLIGITLMFGVPAGISANASKDLANDHKIVEMADNVEADMSYVNQSMGNYIRLRHNGDEPIYVCFSQDMTEEQKQEATRALDYMFGIVGSINPNYRYEIVDKDKCDSLFLKSRIYFNVRELGVSEDYKGEQHTIGGNASKDMSYGSLLQLKPLLKQLIISLDDDNDEDIYYTYCHELMHAFGLKDVYDYDKDFFGRFQGNTMLKQAIGEHLTMLTPNDMKVLVALYAPKVPRDQREQKLAEYRDFLTQYEKEYYSKFVDLCKGQIYQPSDMNQRNFSFQSRYTALDGITYRYNITINGDRYTFQIENLEKGVLDSTEGEVLWVNGGVVLKNVELQKGLYPLHENTVFPNGYLKDFAICQGGRGNAYICEISGKFTRKGIRGFVVPPQTENNDSTENNLQ